MPNGLYKGCKREAADAAWMCILELSSPDDFSLSREKIAFEILLKAGYASILKY